MNRLAWMRKASRFAVLVGLGYILSAFPSALDSTRTADAMPSGVRWYQNAINDTMTAFANFDWTTTVNAAGAKFTAESTVVYAMPPGTRAWVFIRAIPAAGDTTTPIRLALSVKVHRPYQTAVVTSDSLASTDTASVALWSLVGQQGAGASGGLIDTVGNISAATAPTVGSGVGTWANERIIAWFYPVRGRGASKSNQFFGWPDAQWIPIQNGTGPFWAPYVSFRLRCLQASAKPKISMDVVFAPE